MLLEGSFAQRPLFGSWLTKTVAIVAVVAVWAALAVVGISALDSRLSNEAHEKALSSSPPLSVPSSPTGSSGTSASSGGAAGGSGTNGSSTNGSGSGSGSGGGAGSGSGNGGAVGSGNGGGAGSGTGGGAGSGTGGGAGSGGKSGAGSGKGGSKAGAGNSGGSGSGTGGGGGSGATPSNGGNNAGSGSANSSAGTSGSAGAGVAGNQAGASAVTPPGTSANAANTARVSGKVASPVPGGVTVSISPTSLVDEQAQGASFATAPAQTASVSTKPSGVDLASYKAGEPDDVTSFDQAPIGKVYGTDIGSSISPVLSSQEDPTLTTSTTPDGLWAFAGLKAPGYYLVTFSKPGYQTEKYIVSPTAGGIGTQLPVTMTAADGAISGTVFGQKGPLGNVVVTVTDGTITAQTRTPSIGAVGTWTIGGLNTPDTYQVSATIPGYGTQVAIVTLGAGASHSNLDLKLESGVGTISGVVSSASGRVGGATVTATNGTVTVTSTTTTTTPVGTYDLPDLTIPGTYAVTVSGPGYVSQTQEVKLTGNDNHVNAVLVSSSADVTGTIEASGAGLPGAGVTLSNQTNTYKTLSQSAQPAGEYNFGAVPPGQYVLTAEDYGYTTEAAQVTVTAGQLKVEDLSLPYVGDANQDTATVQGTVVNLFNQQPVQGVTVQLDGNGETAITQSNGSYVLDDVGPGIHTVTASGTGFQPASVNVSVAVGGTVYAQPIQLPALDTIAGTVTDNLNKPIPNPSVIAWTVSNTVNASLCPVPTPGASLPSVSGCSYYSSTDPGAGNAYQVPVGASGGFVITDVPQGNYELLFSGPAPAAGTTPDCEMQYSTTTRQMILTLGESTQVITQQLTYLPAYQVSTYLQSTAVPLAGATVTVKDTVTNTSISCPSLNGVTTVSGLTNGDLDEATFSYSAGSGTYTAPAQIFYASAPTGAAPPSAILVPPVSVTLQFPYAGTYCPVETSSTSLCPAAPDLPTVTLSGPSILDSSTLLAATASASGGGNWSFDPPQQAIIDQMATDGLTFTVTDPDGAFETFSQTANKTDAAFLNEPFVLTPAAVQVSGSITPTTATVTSPSFLSDSSGTLSGTAPAPGVYTLDAGESGYVSYSGAFSVPPTPSGSTYTIPAVAMRQLTDLSIVVPSFTAAPSSASPKITVAVSCPADDSSCVSYNAGQYAFGTAQSLTSGQTVTVDDLDPAATYSVTIAVPGYVTYTWSGSLTSGSGALTVGSGTATLSPSLIEEAWVSGTVLGQVGSSTATLLGGATVTLVPPTTPGDCSGSPAWASATSANDGTFTVIGVPGCSGTELIPGSYDAVVTAANYGTQTVPVTLTAGPNTPASLAPVTLGASSVNVTVAVNRIANGTTSKLPNGTSVTIGATTTTAGSPAGTGSSEACPVTVNSNNYTCYSVDGIDPTAYTFTVSASGYVTNAVATTVPADATTANKVVDVTLTEQDTLNITASFSPAVASPAPTITVSVSCPANDPACTAGSTYSFATANSISSATPVSIGGLDPAATYTVAISVPGYENYTWTGNLTSGSGLSTSGTTVALAPALTREAWVSGTVDGLLGPGATASGLSGATVTVVPVSTDPTTCGVTGPSATTASDGTFTVVGSGTQGSATDLPPGQYDAVVGATGYACQIFSVGTLSAGANRPSALAPVTLSASEVGVTVALTTSSGSGLPANVVPTISATSSDGGATTKSATQSACPSGVSSSTYTCYSMTVDPLSYTFAVSASGYLAGSVSTSGDLALGSTPSTNIVELQLNQLSTLVVAPTTFSAANNGTDPTITVSVTCPSGDTGCTTYNSGQPSSYTGAQLTIANLDPTATYTVTIAIAGYETYIWGPATLGSSSGDLTVNGSDATLTPSLTQEAYVTGLVEGQIGTGTNALPGATVTVVPYDAGTTSCATANSSDPSAVTSSTGNFIVTGKNTGSSTNAENLVPSAGPYCVIVAATGYPTSTDSDVTLSAGDNSASPTSPLVANQITATIAINVTSLSGGTLSYQSPPASTVVTANSPVGSPATTSTSVSCSSFATVPAGQDYKCYQLSLDPTTYSFSITASGYPSVSIDNVSFAPGVTPQPQLATLSQSASTITGTVSVVNATNGNVLSNMPAGVDVDLYSVSSSDGTYTKQSSTTTSASGTYAFSNLGGGLYAVRVPVAADATTGAAGEGYSYYGSPPATIDAEGGANSVSVSLTLPDVNQEADVTSTLPSQETLAATTATLTPVATWPTNTPSACSAAVADTGQATPQTVTVSSEDSSGVYSGTAEFDSLVPGYYSFDVAGDSSITNGSIPTQTATHVWICPGGDSTNPAFQVQEGEISGTITIADAAGTSDNPSDVSVTVTSGSGGSTYGPVNPSSSSGDYTLVVPLATGYTVNASLSGFTPTPSGGCSSSCNLTSTSPSNTYDASLSPTAVSVPVQVENDSSSGFDLPRVPIVLDCNGSDYTATTSSGGAATFTDVTPNDSDDCTVSFDTSGTGGASWPANVSTSLELATNSIQVTVGYDPPSPTTLTAAFGEISGTITDSHGGASPVEVSATDGSGDTASASVTLSSHTGTYALYLPPASYSVTFTDSAGTPNTATITPTVTDGTDTTGSAENPTLWPERRPGRRLRGARSAGGVR